MTRATIGSCEGCGADVYWALTDRGKKVPVDPDPRADGNWATWRDHLGQLRARPLTRERPVEAHEKRGALHFATCPKAERFRTRKVPAQDISRYDVPVGATVDLPAKVTPLATRRRRP